MISLPGDNVKRPKSSGNLLIGNSELSHWGFVEDGQPQTFLSMRISCSRKDGIRWYSIDQSEDIAQLLVDGDVTGTVPVTAPMPDRDELTSDPTPVTPLKTTQVGEEGSWCVELLRNYN